jgi:hypothetical protein
MFLTILAIKGIVGFSIVGGAVLTGVLITIIIERQMREH